MQQRLHPRGQLGQRKGLHQVIVRARVKTCQPVVQRIARRHHDHRGIARRFGPQAAAKLVAVQPRQHQVQHDQVEAARGRHRVATLPVFGAIDDVAAPRQMMRDVRQDVRVVFDD
ncbi:hypothetical protein G6F65_018862 [Rhizopus arrhizus]|nr:hypothetical protein G6F65_018862 [Rhizopus arrhizus]